MSLRGFWIIAFIVLVFFAPGFVYAVEYGGLGGVPAQPDPSNPRTQSIFIHTLAPGASKQDAVKVVNNTPETKIIEIYAADSEIASGGSFACRQKADKPIAVGTWIKMDATEVEVPSNSHKIVSFNIQMPESVSVGEHNGCIVIQEKDGATEQIGNGVQLSFRSALRVAITVPGDIVKDIDFAELNARQEPKKYVLTAKLQNKGNVSLDTDIKVRIKTLTNRTIYENGGVYPLLTQKQPIELNFDFQRPFWGGLYRITGTANYNDDVAAALGSSTNRDRQKQAPSSLLFIAPQPLAIAIIALIIISIIVLAWLLLSRLLKSRRHNKGKLWEDYRVRKGDTIAGIASRRNVEWKIIAKKNKLRPPYDLKPGSTIKVPERLKS